ncbi:hypothetical protein [Scytonema millei]|uniref:Phytanoyl-CoA dioxygenase (PhyH) n=1 Tax=Scytonema millei VB511283 TaxID=1245923 RepID=A0A9X5E6W7_9CYAN|nr:hypothetical protein [Scytonema millei]NHC36021.1 hypothetical protein [Scytonema millei VB511283]
MSTTISYSYWYKLYYKFKRRLGEYTDYGFKNPQWLLMFVFGRIHIIRSLMILLASKPELIIPTTDSSLFTEIDVDSIVENLKRDGVCLGIHLPNYALNEILNFTNQTYYFANGEFEFPFTLDNKEEQEAKYGKPFLFGYHHQPYLSCATIEKLGNDPKLRQIAAKYLVGEPIVKSIMLWWSFATPIEQTDERLRFAQGLFHYDLDDYRCLQFLFYLTDVDLYSGPHAYVKGSHIKKKLQYQLSIDRDQPEQELINYYGSDKIINICGKAGMGFAEDQFCFHRANIPTKKDRLILQIKFVLNRYSFS